MKRLKWIRESSMERGMGFVEMWFCRLGDYGYLCRVNPCCGLCVNDEYQYLFYIDKQGKVGDDAD